MVHVKLANESTIQTRLWYCVFRLYPCVTASQNAIFFVHKGNRISFWDDLWIPGGPYDVTCATIR